MPEDSEGLDALIRMEAFSFIEREKARVGEQTLPYQLLKQGFDFRGRRVPLLGPQGIFKPAVLPELPLSIATAPPRPGKPAPYDDLIGPDDLLHYRYRGTDPKHRDNVGLRKAMARQIPLVYLLGVVPGRYDPFWPAYIVGDDPSRLTFRVAIDRKDLALTGEPALIDGTADLRRAYATREAQYRMHQDRFRERVLRAYRERCTICHLRHRELLDATHILPDKHPRGEPLVSNGLSLCKLHHAAYDRNILGIDPDLHIQIRPDVMTEEDGPMLRHGLQGLQGARLLVVPRRPPDRPNPDFLAERYDEFRRAS